MIGYIVLAVFCLSLALFAYKIFKKDLLSPTFISALMFLLAVSCAIVGLFSWNYVKELSLQTILIFIAGLTAFGIGEVIARSIHKNKTKSVEQKVEQKTEVEFNLSNKVLVVILLLVLLSTALMISEIIRVCATYGYTSNSFLKVLAFYRSKTGLFSDAAFSSEGVNVIVRQLWKVGGAINIILFYYGFQKILRLKKKINKKEIVLIALILVVTLFQTFLFNGGRSIFFHYIVAYIAIALFVLFVKGRKNITKSMVRRGAGIVAALLVVFYLILPIVGRSTRHGFFEYTTFSLGTAVPSFELYMNDDEQPDEGSKYIGEETFSGVYYTLNKVGLIKYAKAQSHEWRSFADDGTLSSNTYTSLRTYYKDFGMLGVIILQFIFGLVVTLIYLKVKESGSMLACVIYFSYFYILIDQIRDEQFYSLISISTLANIGFTVITYYVIKSLGSSKNEKNTK